MKLVPSGEHKGKGPGEYDIVASSDGVEIQILLPPGERIESRYVQIIGKVINGNTIEAQTLNSAGDAFDMELYNRAIEQSTQFPQIYA